MQAKGMHAKGAQMPRPFAAWRRPEGAFALVRPLVGRCPAHSPNSTKPRLCATERIKGAGRAAGARVSSLEIQRGLAIRLQSVGSRRDPALGGAPDLHLDCGGAGI